MKTDTQKLIEAQQAKMVEEFGRAAAPGKKLVRSMMSDKVVEIDEGAPGYMDPSRESYWSM